MSDTQSIRIKNNREADIELPMVLVASKNPRERAKRLFQSRKLRPGLNMVPAKYYDAIKENPQVKGLFDEPSEESGKPMLELIGPGDSSFSDSTMDQAIENRSLEEAYVMINECDSVEQLEAWASMDTRKQVMDTIMAKLEILERNGKEAKKGI